MNASPPPTSRSALPVAGLRRFRHRRAAESFGLTITLAIVAWPFLHWSNEAGNSDRFSTALAMHLTACCSLMIAAVSSRIAVQRHHARDADGGVVTAGVGAPSPERWRLAVFVSWAVPTAIAIGVVTVALVQMESSLGFRAGDGHPLPSVWQLSALGLRSAAESLVVSSVAVLLTRLPWRGMETPLLGGAVMGFWFGHHLFPLTSSTTGISASGAPTPTDEPPRFLLQGEFVVAAILLAIGLVAGWLACSGAPEPPRHRSAPER